MRLALLRRVLGILEKVFGPHDPRVATRLNNLGRVLQDLGDMAGARSCYDRALAIDEKAYGPDHRNVAVRLNNLGTLLRDSGDVAGAESCFVRP